MNSKENKREEEKEKKKKRNSSKVRGNERHVKFSCNRNKSKEG